MMDSMIIEGLSPIEMEFVSELPKRTSSPTGGKYCKSETALKLMQYSVAIDSGKVLKFTCHGQKEKIRTYTNAQVFRDHYRKEWIVRAQGFNIYVGKPVEIVDKEQVKKNT